MNKGLIYNSERKCWESNRLIASLRRAWKRDFVSDSPIFKDERNSIIMAIASNDGALTHNISKVGAF